MKLFRRKFYGTLNFDEFMVLWRDLANIGIDMSAYPPDYGKAICWNCRAIINVGVEEMSREYAMKHRRVCGYENLASPCQQHCIERLAQ